MKSRVGDSNDNNIMREDVNLNQYRNYAFPVWAVYLVSLNIYFIYFLFVCLSWYSISTFNS